MTIQFMKPASSPFSDENDTSRQMPEDEGSFVVDLDAEGDDLIVVEKDDDEQEQGQQEQAAQGNDQDDDDLSKYSENVQKRIKKLSFEFHESERGRTAARSSTSRILHRVHQLYH